jgi:hypothetical protein
MSPDINRSAGALYGQYIYVGFKPYVEPSGFDAWETGSRPLHDHQEDLQL